MTTARHIIGAILDSHELITSRFAHYECAGCTWWRRWDDDEALEDYVGHLAKAIEGALCNAGLLAVPGQAAASDHITKLLEDNREVLDSSGVTSPGEPVVVRSAVVTPITCRAMTNATGRPA